MVKKSVLLLGLLLMTLGVLRAQNTQPVVLLLDGDIWTWNEGDMALTQLTQWGYNYDLALNPVDPNQAAYSSVAQIVVDVIRREGGFSGRMLQNIWTYDLTTRQGYRVANQPTDASFNVTGVPDKGVVRVGPMWSPDGTRVAWTEFDYPESNLRLMVFDVATKLTNVVAENIPMPTGGIPDGLYGAWLDSGLVFTQYTLKPDGSFLNTSVLVFAPDGTQLGDYLLPETPEFIYVDSIFLQQNGKDYAGILFNNLATAQLEWRLLDLATGAITPMQGTPERVAVDAPDTSLRLVWTSNAEAGDEYALDRLTVKTAAGDIVELPVNEGNFVRTAYLSPDGQAVLYYQYRSGVQVNYPELYVWRAGVQTMLPTRADSRILDIFWGKEMWQIR